jgi:hypothetical protein
MYRLHVIALAASSTTTAPGHRRGGQNREGNQPGFGQAFNDWLKRWGKSVIWLFMLMLLLPLALPTTVLAQGAGTASFDGVLLDTAGKPAPGYPLVLKTPEGQQVQLQGTGEGGSFALSGMPPGNYEVWVLPKGGGKTPLVSHKMALVAGQKARLDIRLTSNAPAAAATTERATGSAGTTEPATRSVDSGMAGFGWIVMSALTIGVVVVLYFRGRSGPRA